MSWGSRYWPEDERVCPGPTGPEKKFSQTIAGKRTSRRVPVVPRPFWRSSADRDSRRWIEMTINVDGGFRAQAAQAQHDENCLDGFHAPSLPKGSHQWMPYLAAIRR